MSEEEIMEIVRKMSEVPKAELGDILKNISIVKNSIKRNWKEISINENKEPLVLITPKEKLIVKSVYYEQGINDADEELYARESVVNGLNKAASSLPYEYTLIIKDAYRKESVQTYLYNNLLSRIQNENQNLTTEECIKETEKYVAPVAKGENGFVSPHLSGGAVDVMLGDKCGNELPMGADFDFEGIESSTIYYEGKELLTGEEKEFLQNRRLLYWIMKLSGFTNYEGEYWHYDMGNQFDCSRYSVGNAKYGYIELPKK